MTERLTYLSFREPFSSEIDHGKDQRNAQIQMGNCLSRSGRGRGNYVVCNTVNGFRQWGSIGGRLFRVLELSLEYPLKRRYAEGRRLVRCAAPLHPQRRDLYRNTDQQQRNWHHIRRPEQRHPGNCLPSRMPEQPQRKHRNLRLFRLGGPRRLEVQLTGWGAPPRCRPGPFHEGAVRNSSTRWRPSPTTSASTTSPG